MAAENRLPSLRALRAFQVAARHLSFKDAAEELFVSPSAISQHVRNLEDFLGFPLFERKTRALALTPAGARYFAFLDAMFDRLESETRQLRSRFGRAIVRLSVPPFFASEALLPRLQVLQNLAEDLDIRVSTIPSRMRAHPAEADLSVLLGSPDIPDLITYTLCPRRLVVACAPSLLASMGGGPTSLDGQVLIIHEHRPKTWDYWAERAGRPAPRPAKLLRFDSMNAVVQAAVAGLGIALISWPLSKAWFDRGALTRVFDVEVDSGETFFLAHRPEESHRPEIMQVAQWMLREFNTASLMDKKTLLTPH